MMSISDETIALQPKKKTNETLRSMAGKVMENGYQLFKEKRSHQHEMIIKRFFEGFTNNSSVGLKPEAWKLQLIALLKKFIVTESLISPGMAWLEAKRNSGRLLS
uniref:Uncharacterized protein n=1 Tax=Glossina pallidipes TaxID=7398 RepID=A0A1B0A1G0_GLOPL